MNLRYCDKVGNHQGSAIQAICISKECENNRMLCCFCVFSSHFEHQVVYLRQDPKDNLSNQAKQQPNIFLKAYIQLYVNDAFDTHLRNSRKGTLEPVQKLQDLKETIRIKIQTAIQEFFTVSSYQIIFDFTSNIPLQNHKIEKYVEILSLINFPKQNIVEQVGKLCFENIPDLCQPMKDAFHKIQVALRNFRKSIKRFGTPEHSQIKVKSEHEPHQIYLQGNLLQKQFEQILKNKVECNMKIIKNICLTQDLKEVPKKREYTSFQDRLVNEALKGQSMMDVQKQGQQKQNPNANPLKMEQEQCSIKQISIQKKADKNLLLQIPQIFISCNSCHQLLKVLTLYERKAIRHLVIKCDSRIHCFTWPIIFFIALMDQLISLKIYVAYEMSEQQAIQLTKGMHNLQELVLAEFSNLGDQLVQSLKQNNHKLKRVCFTYDMENIINSQEMLQFFPDISEGNRPQQYWQNLTNSNLFLTNIEVQNGKKIAYWVKYVKKSKNRLREVVISNPIEKTKVNFTPLIKALQSCINLQYLRLQQITCDLKSITVLIQNNQNLKAIHLSQCKTQKQTFQVIFNLPHLQYLLIAMDDTINQDLVFASDKIETIIIRGCFQFQSNILAKNIKRLKNLRCLSVDYSIKCFDSSESAQEIANSESIRYLNISQSKTITNHFQTLMQMQNLQCLVCQDSDISYLRIAKCRFAPKLKKLSISGVEYHEDLYLENLVESFPNLTHLKILHFRRIVGSLQLFSRMKSLVSIIGGMFGREADEKQLIRYCKKMGINYQSFKQQQQ